MRKIVWIDVGTHLAQEYDSVMGSNFNIYIKLLRRFIGWLFLSKGKFLNIRDLKSIFYAREIIKKNKNRFSFYFVEANSKIINKKKAYLNANGIFNIALIDRANKAFRITKLFIANNNAFSTGNSIFKNKKNININHFIFTAGISTDFFFKEIKLNLEQEFGKNYLVLLRLNCEGVEDDIIYSAHSFFKKKLSLICGTIDDVEKCKGNEAYKELMKFMTLKKISFVNFSPSVNTWPKAHLKILNLLRL
jgi:hypothetical protein